MAQNLGSKRALVVLKFLSPNYQKVGSTHVVNMAWERNLPSKIYSKFQNLETNCDCFVKHCDINFKTFEKSLQFSHLYYTL